jgi:hypothetical protein
MRKHRSDSRDANDPRDLLRALNKEEREEFEREEMDDTGGQEHASRADREGSPDGNAGGAPPEPRSTDRDRR